jgi:hypothetical protein
MWEKHYSKHGGARVYAPGDFICFIADPYCVIGLFQIFGQENDFR